MKELDRKLTKALDKLLLKILTYYTDYFCIDIFGHDAELFFSRKGAVEFLIEKGADVNVKDIAEDTPLHIACAEGHTDIVKLLIEKGADVNSQNKRNSTPLHKAMSNTHCLKLLLDSGADVTIKDSFGDTVLDKAYEISHDACIKTILESMSESERCVNSVKNYQRKQLYIAIEDKNIKKIKKLIDEGVDVNAKDDEGSTALHWACWGKKADCAKLLLEHGADVDLKDVEGWTALHWACRDKNADCVRLLLKHRADVNLKNNNGSTALHYAYTDVNTDCAKLLLEHGADVNLKNIFGNTALHFACFYGKINYVELLLKHGADVSLEDIKGNTAFDNNSDCVNLIKEHIVKNKEKLNEQFLEAIHGDNRGTVMELLGKGVDINYQSILGNTPLHMACAEGHLDCVNLLLERGADVSIRNDEGKSVVQVAHDNNSHKCSKAVALLLVEMANKGNTEKVKELLKVVYVDYNNWLDNGNTALHQACKRGHLDCVKLLLDNNASLDKTDVEGETALHYACYNGHLECTELLLKNGADTSIVSKWDNHTVLEDAIEFAEKSKGKKKIRGIECARLIRKYRYLFKQDAEKAKEYRSVNLFSSVKSGCTEELTQLLAKGVDVESKSLCGNTALYCACLYGNAGCAKLLLKHGADINAQEMFGNTALHTACEYDRDSCVKLLVEYGADVDVKNKAGISCSEKYASVIERALQL